MDKGPTSPSDVNVTTQPSSYSAGYNQPGDFGAQGGMAPQGYGYPPPNPGFAAASHNTTVIIQQPGAMQMHMPRQWSTDICGCFEDIGTCCYGTFCGWCMAMGLAEDLGESSCVPCCVPGALIVMRTKMRLMHNIQGTIMDDCCTVVCCGHCALCQMAREMNNIRSSATMRP